MHSIPRYSGLVSEGVVKTLKKHLCYTTKKQASSEYSARTAIIVNFMCQPDRPKGCPDSW